MIYYNNIILFLTLRHTKKIGRKEMSTHVNCSEWFDWTRHHCKFEDWNDYYDDEYHFYNTDDISLTLTTKSTESQMCYDNDLTLNNFGDEYELDEFCEFDIYDDTVDDYDEYYEDYEDCQTCEYCTTELTEPAKQDSNLCTMCKNRESETNLDYQLLCRSLVNKFARKSNKSGESRVWIQCPKCRFDNFKSHKFCYLCSQLNVHRVKQIMSIEYEPSLEDLTEFTKLLNLSNLSNLSKTEEDSTLIDSNVDTKMNSNAFETVQTIFNCFQKYNLDDRSNQSDQLSIARRFDNVSRSYFYDDTHLDPNGLATDAITKFCGALSKSQIKLLVKQVYYLLKIFDVAAVRTCPYVHNANQHRYDETVKARIQNYYIVQRKLFEILCIILKDRLHQSLAKKWEHKYKHCQDLNIDVTRQLSDLATAHRKRKTYASAIQLGDVVARSRILETRANRNFTNLVEHSLPLEMRRVPGNFDKSDLVHSADGHSMTSCKENNAHSRALWPATTLNVNNNQYYKLHSNVELPQDFVPSAIQFSNLVDVQKIFKFQIVDATLLRERSDVYVAHNL